MQTHVDLNTVYALGLIVIAAIMNGVYTLPMKLNRLWAWEHSWFAFTIVGVMVVPTGLAMFTIPELWSIYFSIPIKLLLALALFGLGWGISLVLFGLALNIVGVAITFAVCLGTSAAAGALIPLVSQHPESLRTQQGYLILAGVGLIFLGVGLCGAAGWWRDQVSKSQVKVVSGSSIRGFLYALLAGALGSLFNVGLAFGGPIQQAARDRGASLAMMSTAVWLPCLFAGFIPGIIYCFILMKKNGNLSLLRAEGTWSYWLTALCMGILWFGSLTVYAISTTRLGSMGATLGWPLFMSAIVITSTLAGAITGEWSRAGKGSTGTMVIGVACLIIAMGMLSQAG